MRGEGTFAAVRREMAEARASRSVTGLFEHRIHLGRDVPSGEEELRSAGQVGHLPLRKRNLYTAVVASAFSFSD